MRSSLTDLFTRQHLLFLLQLMGLGPALTCALVLPVALSHGVVGGWGSKIGKRVSHELQIDGMSADVD